MLEGIGEENQVHSFLFIVVLGQEEFNLRLDLLNSDEIFVEAWVLRLTTGLTLSEVTIEQVWLHDFLLSILEVLADESRNDLFLHQVLIDAIDEAIAKDAMALVTPQANELPLRLELVNSGEVKTFVHTAEITQVEDVMELERRTWKFLQAGVVKLESGLSDCINRCLNVISKVGQVLA